MKSILCYGDSNTFGENPEGGRHPRNIRWTGILQKLLGEDYYIIEEGLNGRTTVFEDPLETCRNGAEALPFVLKSHKPLDLVLIMLGTNDCKTHFALTATGIANGLERLVRMILHFDYGNSCKIPEIFIVSPIHIGDNAKERPASNFEDQSVVRSKGLAAEYERVAKAYGCRFFDASTVAVPSRTDQIHMDADNHRALAGALAAELKNWSEGK